MREPVISGHERRPRHETGDEGHLRCFQLIRIKKTADARQIRHKLSIVRLPAKRHWIKPIDEVATVLKLCRLKEELRDVYAIAVGITGSTVVDGADPTGQAGWIRFAAEEVQILLAHKEVCVVNRIGTITGGVIGNRDGRD